MVQTKDGRKWTGEDRFKSAATRTLGNYLKT